MHKTGFAIRTIHEGGGGPASPIISSFIVLKAETNNNQSINNNSPKKTFLADSKSHMLLEIINKKPIPILYAATTSAKPLTNSNVSTETDGAIVSTEKAIIPRSSTPNSKFRDAHSFLVSS